MDPQSMPWLMLGGAVVALIVVYGACRLAVRLLRWLFRP